MRTRAAVFWAVGEPFTVEELDVADPGPRDVVVAVAAVGICGTDLHQVKGEFRRPTPMVLGHEGAGVVEAVGDDVTSVAPGDRVVLSWAPSCGACFDCAKRRRPAACAPLHRAIGAGTLVDGTTGLSLRGETVYRGTATGCLAERVVVAEGAVLPLGEGIPFAHAALLGCAALTGVGAVLFAARAEVASCLVVGAGAVGQFVVQGARLAGAELVVVADPVPERREQALALGATHAVDPVSLEEALRELAPDGCDATFDAVGHPSTTAAALDGARSGGTCVMVGLPAVGARLDLDPAVFLRREKRLTGTMYGSEDPAVALPLLLDHVRAGRLELASLVGETFPLDEVNAAVEASLAGTGGRVLVLPR
jgi:S-(hydroxymethyl)glutathione dehydrogenase/alcohol dehydrogenase